MDEVVIIENGVEKCRFVPREMGDDYLITPSRYRPWPVTPGVAEVRIGRRLIGRVTTCRREQFQRCRIEFDPVRTRRKRRSVRSEEPAADGGEPESAGEPPAEAEAEAKD